MREFSDFEVDYDIAPEETVVEDEVNIEIVGIEGEPFLPGFEEKSFAEFQEKYFQFIDDGGFLDCSRCSACSHQARGIREHRDLLARPADFR